MKYPKLKTIYDSGEGNVSFIVNDEFICQWECEDFEMAESMQESFIEVFSAGIKSTGKAVAVVAHGDVEIVNE